MLRLTEIDALIRSDHSYLSPEDRCFFLGEYTARAGYAHSKTNQLIVNLKKSPEKKELPEWPYKCRAIRKAAKMFRVSLREELLTTATLVPIPPSKAKDHPLYDDRMLLMLRMLGRDLEVDIRELTLNRESTEAVHKSEDRPTPQQLTDNYYIDETIAQEPPKTV